MAHTRIHTETGNQVCPDCGENFGDRMADFNKHIKLHCFHTSRITGYRCPVSYPSFSTDFYGLYLILIHVFQLSGKVFARLDYLVSHIHNNLLIRFFKCAECPVAFRSQNKIMIHTKVNYQLRSNLTNFTQPLPISLKLKGSSDPSHFIFEINVGKSRIRHRTTLNFMAPSSIDFESI